MAIIARKNLSDFREKHGIKFDASKIIIGASQVKIIINYIKF